jgi:hypothetical protein
MSSKISNILEVPYFRPLQFLDFIIISINVFLHYEKELGKKYKKR